jgi:nicotinamide-nucleotide amidase
VVRHSAAYGAVILQMMRSLSSGSTLRRPVASRPERFPDFWRHRIGAPGKKRKTIGHPSMKIDQLARRILKQAKADNLTIATAESCTAGAVATALSKAPGANDNFQGGFVTYTKAMKNVVLRVPIKLLKNKGAVCKEVAEAMALGALKLAPADIAVAVTGVAGPEPDEDGNPVGLVYCCVARPKRKPVTVCRFFKGRSRAEITRLAVKETLTLLWRNCRR